MNQLEKRKALELGGPTWGPSTIIKSWGPPPTNWMRVHQMRVDLADETPSVLDTWILAQKTIWFGWLFFFHNTAPFYHLPFFCPTTLNCILKAKPKGFKLLNICCVENWIVWSIWKLVLECLPRSEFIFFCFLQWASLIGPSQKNSENLEPAQV